jgi:hypothetical protein
MEVATTCGAVVSEEVGEDRGAGRRGTVCGTLGREDAGMVTIASNPNFWEHSCTMQHGSTRCPQPPATHGEHNGQYLYRDRALKDDTRVPVQMEKPRKRTFTM